MSTSAGVALVALAYVVHWKGIGPDWLAWRLAQVLALAGLTGLLEPVAPQLREWTTAGLEQIAEIVAGVVKSSAYTNAIVEWTPKLAAGFAFLVWFGAFITPRASKWLGRIANQQAKSAIVWGAGVVMVLFGLIAGGNLEAAITWLADLFASWGEGLLTWIFGGV